jgi:hypothetical protein
LLKARIEADFKVAYKSQDKFATEVLRMVKAEVKNREIEKGAGISLGDDEVIAVVSSSIKKRRDSVEMFTKGGRQELADKEAKEAAFLAQYLPEQMGEDELREKVKSIIAGMDSPGLKQMGLVMKAVIGEVGKKADGSLVSKVVKELLGG